LVRYLLTRILLPFLLSSSHPLCSFLRFFLSFIFHTYIYFASVEAYI
jgi:hypothetical protein